MTAPRSTPARHDHAALELHTPELVALQLPLAGLGSRLLAQLWDLLLMLLMWLPLWLLYLLVDASTSGGVPTALLLLGSFAIFWGYGFWFEWRRDGQTPGKRKCHLRTVLATGHGLTARAAAVRQLLRLVDLQPAGSGLLGMLLVMFTRNQQRLGDLAAGTVVVRDQPAEFPLPSEATARRRSRTASGPPRVSASLLRALDHYAESSRLEPAARDKLAGLLTHKLVPLVPREPGESFATYLARVHDEESARHAAEQTRRGSGQALANQQLAQRREEWVAFQALTQRLRKQRGLSTLDGDEVRAFAARHRAVSADLARARIYGADPKLLWALQRSLAAAHLLLHRNWTEPGAAHPLWTAFPRLVRRLARPLGLAALLFFGTGAITYVGVRLNPAIEASLLSAGMVERAEGAASREADGLGYVDIDLADGPMASAGLFTNNVQVSFLAFAGGLLAGLGTLAILLLNGIHLGAVFAAFSNRDVVHVLTEFVLPHGVIELSAIVFAAGAGLHMGSALVDPRRRDRWALLVERAREAVGLLLGVVVMLAVAALVEAYLSPSTSLSFTVKASFSAGSAVLLALWIWLAGRTPLRDDGAA